MVNKRVTGSYEHLRYSEKFGLKSEHHEFYSTFHIADWIFSN